MRFLQVKDDEAIAIDKIKRIKSSGMMSCKVHTASDVYEINLPFKTLMSMLGNDETESAALQKILNILKTMGTATP